MRIITRGGKWVRWSRCVWLTLPAWFLTQDLLYECGACCLSWLSVSSASLCGSRATLSLHHLHFPARSTVCKTTTKQTFTHTVSLSDQRVILCTWCHKRGCASHVTRVQRRSGSRSCCSVLSRLFHGCMSPSYSSGGGICALCPPLSDGGTNIWK